MRVFKNLWFERFAKKQKITDNMLLEAVQRAEKGQIDANLGKGVLKQRIARVGQGRSAGYRTIILYRTTKRAFFVYGFCKNDRANIDDDEKALFKTTAIHVLALSDQQLAELISKKQFYEVNQNDEKISQ